MPLVERVVIGVDMQRFSSRVTRRQVLLQRELDRMLDDAADSAGINRKLWERRAAGDGEVAVLPSDVDLLAVVRQFVSELDLLLTDHNEDHIPETRIRLRVAMHSDVIAPGTLGYAGSALVVLQRLLDAEPVRTALTETPEANLAQIISESLYQRSVVHELGGLRPRQFTKVSVELPAKEFHQPAYVYVPGGWPAPQKTQPTNPTERSTRPSGFPLSFLTATPIEPLPEQPPVGVLQVNEPQRKPKTDQPALSPGVRKLVQEVRGSLKKRDVERADTVTTLALLEAAGRSHHGFLREADGRRLPDVLFTELNAAWAEFSVGAWGFQTQRKRIDGLALSRPGNFRRLLGEFGWNGTGDEDERVPYAQFILRSSRNVPFYPTLRNPEREQEPDSVWRDEWPVTVRSVYIRLQSWGQ